MKKRAQVLAFQPALTHSVWLDFTSRHRSTGALEKTLRRLVRKGEYVGYRLITVEVEHVGVSWNDEKKGGQE